MSRRDAETNAIRPFVIGIAGPSCSGKTTIARQLATQLGDATLFGLDAYYHDLAHLTYEQRAQFNFDHPESLEAELLIEHVVALAQGSAIERPVYDFATHTRVAGASERIAPTRYLIVEGLFTLHWPQIWPAYDARVFVEAPDPVCFERRMDRDVRERGRTPESIRTQYEATVRPMAEQFVLPTRDNADLVVNGRQPIGDSVRQILGFVESRERIS